MKLYRYTCGDHDKLGVAEDEQDAYERRAEVDPAFHYLPVLMEEMKVDGYEINLTPVTTNVVIEVSPREYLTLEQWTEQVKAMNKDQLKTLLRKKEVEFVPQWGEEKLRELALQIQ